MPGAGVPMPESLITLYKGIKDAKCGSPHAKILMLESPCRSA